MIFCVIKHNPTQNTAFHGAFQTLTSTIAYHAVFLLSHVFFMHSFSELRSDSRRTIIRVERRIGRGSRPCQTWVWDFIRLGCGTSLDWGVGASQTGVYSFIRLGCKRLLDWGVQASYTPTSGYRMRHGASVTSNVPFMAKCAIANYARSSNCKTTLPRKQRRLCNRLRNGSVFSVQLIFEH